MGVTKTVFGKTSDGNEVMMYTLENASGMKVTCIDYGANIVNVLVPCKDGSVKDVVLGFDDVAGYELNPPFFGAFIGRVANRIGGASFELNGVTYNLAKNEGENTLHSAEPWYHKLMYDAEVNEAENSVSFMRLSPDMEQGYPGNLNVKVTYRLSDDNGLAIIYDALCDKDTITGFTNHTYFNLDGDGAGSIENHDVKINASFYTATGPDQIPTGELCPVAGTPLDFTTFKKVGQDINADYEPLKVGKGYDHNFVIDKDLGTFGKAAECVGADGLKMEVYTDLPGVQFYSGNNIGNVTNGKYGNAYGFRSGLCFETQYFPNSCNIQTFPSCVLHANEPFHSETLYIFS